jgi:hypothetical protein
VLLQYLGALISDPVFDTHIKCHKVAPGTAAADVHGLGVVLLRCHKVAPGTAAADGHGLGVVLLPSDEAAEA